MATDNKKKKKNPKDSVRRGVIAVWSTVFILLFLFFGFIGAISWGWFGRLPEISELQNPISKSASRIYTADGKLMGTWSYASANRIMVPYDSLPANLINALIAIEDERFYEHSGIDMRAFGRAVVKRGVMRQKSAGGGSTITQQLAKQLYSDVNASTSTATRLMQKPVEWYIAVQLERNYTKEEIITMYLNYFDFLNNAVGIKNAAHTYFEKLPIDLTLDECATLAGMPKNPSLYNPVRYNERCRERRNLVLEKMCEQGFITEDQKVTAQAKPLDVSHFHPMNHQEGLAPYVREYLRRIMMAERPERSRYYLYQQFYDDSLQWETNPLFGWCNKNHKADGSNYNIYTDGLKVYTTIDSRMQKDAEEAAYEHVAKYLQPIFENENRSKTYAPYVGLSQEKVEYRLRKAYKNSDRYRKMKADGCSAEEIERAFTQKVPMTLFSYNGEFETEMSPRDSILYYKKFLRTAMCAMDPHTGEVRAYVGGLDFKYFQYDNVMGGGRRQVGSTIKPYLYSLAMMNGYTPCDEAPNVPRSYGGWTPRSTGARLGQMVTLKWGLSMSSNTISAWVLSQLNPRSLINLMHLMGITTQNIRPDMTLCLGTCDVSVGEMTSAYTTFANYGVRVAPLLVNRIEDASGNVIATFDSQFTDIMDREDAYKMIVMMRGVINEGTGRRLRGTYNIKADLCGKTGTTNSNADGWFMGVAPKLVVGTWVGGEERDIHFISTYYGQGAGAALPVFALFIKKVYADPSLVKDYGITPNDKFEIPTDFDVCEGELTGLQRAERRDEVEVDESVGEIDELFQ